MKYNEYEILTVVSINRLCQTPAGAAAICIQF